jgi:hypothetical protein
MRVNKVMAGIAAAGLLAAGCGTGATADAVTISAGKGGGAELFAAMAEAQQEAGGYRFEMTTDVEGVEITMTGEAVAGATPADSAMSATMSMPGAGESEMRMVDSKMYMSAAMLGIPGADQWLLIDLEGGDAFSDIFADLMGDALTGTDMQAQLNEYADVIEVEEVGTSTLDGVDVTEYQLTTDITASAEMLGMDEALFEQLPVDEVTQSLFVDDDQLAREMRTDLGGMGTVTMRFFDYGTDVTVEAPADDQVTDFFTLMEEVTGQELTDEDLAQLEELFGEGAQQ